MKRAVTWGLGLYLLCALIGRFVEGVGVVRCGCAADCWCRRPGLSAFRWVFPYGHQPSAEPAPSVAPADDADPAPVPVTTPRYWLYKKKDAAAADGFSGQEPVEWGGHHATRSAEVAKTLNDDLAVGDVVVAYQTDLKAVIGYLRVARVDGPRDDKRLFVQPLHRLDPPFPIHEHKAGTSLADSPAVGGMVMLRELNAQQMRDLVSLSGAPDWVLRGEGPTGGRQG